MEADPETPVVVPVGRAAAPVSPVCQRLGTLPAGRSGHQGRRTPTAPVPDVHSMTIHLRGVALSWWDLRRKSRNLGGSRPDRRQSVNRLADDGATPRRGACPVRVRRTPPDATGEVPDDTKEHRK
jgi:hypothetical protein